MCVQGYKGRKTFIATQGPVDTTVDDFWRMIWEHNVSVIVMVANLFERSRVGLPCYHSQCSKYWPDETPKIYDGLEVRPVESTYYSDYAVRSFDITPQKGTANGSALGHSAAVCCETVDAHLDAVAVTVNTSRCSSVRASRESILDSEYANVPQVNADSTRASRTSTTLTATRDADSAARSPEFRPQSLCTKPRRSRIHFAVRCLFVFKVFLLVSILPILETRIAAFRKRASTGALLVAGSDDDERLGTRRDDDFAEVRKVTQYHYTSWNDLQAPECTTGLLRFLSKLRKLHDFNNSPVVVHCSAGVGRTGTFIALDSLLDQCIEEGKADVFGFVSEMRKQRNIMVQNYEQYVFIYKALAEWYMFGETDIEVDQIDEHYRSLKEHHRERHPSNNSSSNISAIAAAVLRSTPKVARANGELFVDKGVNGMELEFRRLERSLDVSRTCEFAHKQENVSKNRFDNAVPYDQCRVILSIVVGSLTDTTYINASLVKVCYTLFCSEANLGRQLGTIADEKYYETLTIFQGYFYPYILAQDPVSEQTCYDFWRMIGDQNSKALVMLSNEEDFSECEKDCVALKEIAGFCILQYWPSEVGRSISFGPVGDVSVKLVSEEVFNSFVLRKFTYKFAKEKMYREVMQFDYLCWPTGNAVPASTDSLIDLISRVLSLQSDHQEAGPIVLHSRDGSSETGVLCCVSLLLERLKAEHRIDVFQTVRSLQQNRPHMFTKLVCCFFQFAYLSLLLYAIKFTHSASANSSSRCFHRRLLTKNVRTITEKQRSTF
ncbi:unnamed protein product [Toxocara canis]|uniref:protein-tyrosine-phosphatase n=1 Tax=Toxocara canis TaxID=6265 RepID=A0A183V5S8_TOXCA|nr:unnamed protein product [Toxocara canis]